MLMDYFYGNQVQQFSAVVVPRELLFGENFTALSLTSKMLYAILLDRMSDVAVNKWTDEENRAYIIYPINQIREDFNFSKHTIIASMNELEDTGLIKRKSVNGKPSRIYVKNFNKKQVLKRIG